MIKTPGCPFRAFGGFFIAKNSIPLNTSGDLHCTIIFPLHGFANTGSAPRGYRGTNSKRYSPFSTKQRLATALGMIFCEMNAPTSLIKNPTGAPQAKVTCLSKKST